MSIFSSNNGDVFRTQADNRFNSFSEPMNPVNMNPGPWGVDPTYLTPSYLSPFRPRYQGPTGQNYSGFRPSWSTSVNQVFNPFAPGGDNYGGNYWRQTSPYYDTLFQKPADTAASFTQNWAAPAAIGYGAYKAFGSMGTGIGRAMGGGLTAGLLRGAPANFASTAVRGGAAIGGFAGGIAIPMLATQAAVSAVDSAIFDPYVAQRRTASGLRENFQGITFGEGGDPFTGGGLSRRSAAHIAKNVSISGARDMTFNQNEASLIADYASRSGLMDNMTPSQMSDRFEKIMKQVKVVMSVANTADFRETIEIMSKLQMAGVGSHQLSGVMGALGASAAIGGQSVQKLMNTVGTQGQYLFGAAGLTPYVGQMTAFNTSASMSAAFRSGLISPAMMSRMGGVEGATQSAVAAQIAAYQTPYANIMASNAYFGGGENGSVVGNMSQFGGRMSGNMLQNVGQHMLTGNALASRHLQDRGLKGEQDMIYQMAKVLPNAIKADGKIDAGVAFMIMTNQRGMTPEMARAKIAQFASYNDPKTVSQMLAGSQKFSVESLMDYQRQEGLNKGILSSPYNAVRGVFMDVQRMGATAVGNFQEGIGGMADSVQNVMNKAFFGIDAGSNKTLEFDSLNIKQINLANRKGLTKTSSNGRTLTNGLTDNEVGHISVQLKKINELAAKGDKDAIKFVSSTGEERAKAVYKLSADKKIDDKYLRPEHADKLQALTDALGTVDPETSSPDKVKTINNTIKAGLDSVLAGKSVGEQLKYMKLMEGIGDPTEVSDAVKSQISQLTGYDVSKLTPQVLGELKDKYTAAAGEGRVYHLAGMEAENMEDLIRQLKKRGGPALAPQVRASRDLKATAQQIQVQKAQIQSRNQINQLFSQGVIDTNSYVGAVNALDSKGAVGKFSDAVDKFVQGVNESKGKGSNSDVPTLWDVVIGGKPRKVSGK